MKQSRASKRYAKALLDLCIEHNLVEECYEDMMLIYNTCSNNKEFSAFLKSPIVKTDKKRKILFEIFDSKIQKNTNTFIDIIVSKKREPLLGQIAESFIELYKIHKNIESATVITASPLQEELKHQIEKYIKLKSNSKVEIKEVVDSAIGGGVIIRMRDKQLDASLKRAIKELKQEFNKNLYIKDF
tara:strand:- start:179 stop:736 length:558 start_codon:yes stop_codon:yes gene_type:complete